MVADLPFLSYQVSRRQAIRSSGKLLKQTNCKAVKFEGGQRMAASMVGFHQNETAQPLFRPT